MSRLNSLFAEMRKSDIYQYKRMSMKMQFEVLKVGLEPSIKLINGQLADEKVLSEEQMKRIDEISQDWPYYRFALSFVDQRSNLQDIMVQLLLVSVDEVRIKEELFNLLSMFILTYEARGDRIKRDLFKNREKLIGVLTDFREHAENAEEDELVQLMTILINKLRGVVYGSNQLQGEWVTPVHSAFRNQEAHV